MPNPTSDDRKLWRMVNRGTDGGRRGCETVFAPCVVQLVGVADACTLQCLAQESVLPRVPHLRFPQLFVLRSRLFDMNIPFFGQAVSWLLALFGP